MLNNFCVFEELVFLDLWILDSGFRIPDSGFRNQDSGFLVLGLPIPKPLFSLVRGAPHLVFLCNIFFRVNALPHSFLFVFLSCVHV